MKHIFLLVGIILFFPLFGQQKQESVDAILLKELYQNGQQLYSRALGECQTLPERSQQLLDAIVQLKKGASEKKKKAYIQPLTNAAYLLGMLQQEITKVCKRVQLVDAQTLKIIIANDAHLLIQARKAVKTRAQYVEAIHNTEYSRFLFDMITVQSFVDMHKKWGEVMSKKHNNPGQIIENISKANHELHDPLEDTLKMLRYYEKL
ncbi:hypothetical protein KAH37_03610 [bacterium]|nr:hypothetical protein [bacterium]